MKITFEITVTNNESDPYTACEIKSLNDGDVWRPSLLQGNSKSIYGAIAKLCLMNLELANATDEIFMLFKYYARLYPEAAQLAIKKSHASYVQDPDNSVFTFDEINQIVAVRREAS